jgi:hypothetical protein
LSTATITALGWFGLIGGVADAGNAAPADPGSVAWGSAAATPRNPATLGDPVIRWNRILLAIQAAPGNQPANVHPTYELAILHAAIYDAVVSINRSAAPYLTTVLAPRTASIAAAADSAAHASLDALYPQLRSSIDHDYAVALARVPAGARRAMGVRAGRRVAAQLLARRAHDGSKLPPAPFRPGIGPGAYQPTPPTFAPPAFTQWGRVRPFALRRGNQFRPPAPPALTSPRYAAAIDAVQDLGAVHSTVRSAARTQIGQFWNAPIWAIWNQIAQTAALRHRGTLSQNARTFARLNLAFADSAIGLYDAKYTYRLWRPITAIHSVDPNRATTTDPSWTPLSPTAPDPSYPGAHATFSAAGAAVLGTIYGNALRFSVTSPGLPGVRRSFTSFSGAAREASVSRILNGNHTSFDEAAGEALGHSVGRFVLRHELLIRAR